jgi:hypothetical protein
MWLDLQGDAATRRHGDLAGVGRLGWGALRRHEMGGRWLRRFVGLRRRVFGGVHQHFELMFAECDFLVESALAFSDRASSHWEVTMVSR